MFYSIWKSGTLLAAYALPLVLNFDAIYIASYDRKLAAKVKNGGS